MNNLKVINGWNFGNSINLLYRNEAGEKKVKHISNFRWYFILPETDLKLPEVSEVIDLATEKNVVLEVEICSPFAKIYCVGDKFHKSVDWLIQKLKSLNVKVMEADLTLTKRYMVDNEVPIEDNLKCCFFDIETDDSNPGIEIGRDQILSWAISDSEGNSFFQKLEKRHNKQCEIDLIKSMVKKFLDYDLVVSWNGDNFDMPYIISRIEKLGITTKNGTLLNKSIFWKNFIHLDMMQQMIRLFGANMSTIGLSGFSLNEVANFFIGEEKVKHTEKIIDLFKYNPDKFEQYNRKDAHLLYKIDEKLGVINLMIKECTWTGCFLNRFYISEMLDNYILRAAKKENIHFKSRPEWKKKGETIDEEQVSIRGGYVMEPKKGLYENIRVFDFSSLYPTTIITFNIGEDTFVNELSEQGKKDFDEWLNNRKLEEVDFKEWYNFLISENKKLNPKKEYLQTANNQFFRKNKPSLLADLLKKLFGERKKYKKLQAKEKEGTPEYKNYKANQEAVKILLNCLHPDTLLYVFDIKSNKYTVKKIEELYGNENQFKIQSYDFKNKKIRWSTIKHIFKKEYDGKLKKLEYLNSLPILCTPEHKFFGMDYLNMELRKTKSNNIMPKWSDKNIENIPNFENIIEKEAKDINYNFLNVCKATPSYETKDLKYFDLRKFDYFKFLEECKYSLLVFNVEKKRYRKRKVMHTSSENFNNYAEKEFLNRACNTVRKLNDGKYRHFITLNKEVWNYIKELTLEECLQLDIKIKPNLSGNEVPIIWELTNDLLWSFGFYLAEGSTREILNLTGGKSAETTICNTTDSFLERYKKTFLSLGFVCKIGISNDKNKVKNVRIYSVILHEILSREFYNSTKLNSYTKTVPQWIFSLSKEKINNFLDGYADGDGNVKDRDKYIRCSSVSKNLTFQMSELFSVVYDKPIKFIKEETDKYSIYRIKITKKSEKKQRSLFRKIENNITYDTIKKIYDVKYKGDVFDIEVENDHNFFIGNILSHNSTYGIQADRNTRYYNPFIAEAITTTGQYINRTAIGIATKEGYSVVYGDTDSSMIVVKKDSDAKKLVDEINEKLETHFKKIYKPIDYFLLLQYEKTFRKFAMVEKKRYAGHLVYLDGKEVNQIMTKGLETVRKATVEYARRNITECLDLILRQDKDEKFIFEWVKNLQNEVLTKDIPAEDLTITTKVSKPIADYKTKGPHVRLAEQLIKENKLLETKAGLKVWGTAISYIIKDGSGKVEAILAQDFDGRWDRKYYWDSQIFSPIYRILSAVFVNTNWKQFNIEACEKEERKRIREEKKIEREKIKAEKALAREAKKLKKEQLTLI